MTISATICALVYQSLLNGMAASQQGTACDDKICYDLRPSVSVVAERHGCITTRESV